MSARPVSRGGSRHQPGALPSPDASPHSRAAGRPQDARGPLRIQILSRANGVGLSQDIELLRTTLERRGDDVAVTTVGHYHSWQSRLARIRSIGRAARAACFGRRACRFDVNFMIERVCPAFFDQAACNVFVPNPEWVRPIWLRFLPRFDIVAVKTRHAIPPFAERGLRVAWLGWFSRDQRDLTVPRETRFLHVAGLSNAKGTPRLLQLWARHPEWPTLHVIWRLADPHTPDLPANVRLDADYVDETTLRTLQNRCRFHLCPSRTEGFGHYIGEAMSVGAVCVATDAPPMNELVTRDRGVLVAARAAGRQNLATLYEFDEEDMRAAVERCIGMSAIEAAAIGARARAWYEGTRDAFPRHLDALLAARETAPSALGAMVQG